MPLLLAGCGGHSRALGNGTWQADDVSFDAAQRSVTFTTACTAHRMHVSVALSAHPDLVVYVRPNGNPAAGHGQRVSLAALAGGRMRRAFVTLRQGRAVAIEEDSGIRPSAARCGGS